MLSLALPPALSFPYYIVQVTLTISYTLTQTSSQHYIGQFWVCTSRNHIPTYCISQVVNLRPDSFPMYKCFIEKVILRHTS